MSKTYGQSVNVKDIEEIIKAYTTGDKWITVLPGEASEEFKMEEMERLLSEGRLTQVPFVKGPLLSKLAPGEVKELRRLLEVMKDYQKKHKWKARFTLHEILLDKKLLQVYQWGAFLKNKGG